MNIARTAAPVLAPRPQFVPVSADWSNMSLSSGYTRYRCGLSSRASTRSAYKSQRIVPLNATPSREETPREQIVHVVQVSPFINAVVIPASLGVVSGYFGMAVAEIGQSFSDTRVGVAFILVTDILSLTLWLLVCVAVATRQPTELRVNQAVTKARCIAVTNSGTSVVMTMESVVAVCGDDISKLSPFLRERFQVSENAQVTIKVTMQGGCEVHLQDQVKADISLSDFLQSTDHVVIEYLSDV